MRDELGLSGVDLLLYAIIYGFSQDGKSCFAGSTKYLQEWTGASEDSVLRHLKKMTDDGILIKKEYQSTGALKRVAYRAIYDQQNASRDPQNEGQRPAKCESYDQQNTGGTTSKMRVNNNSIDNSIDIIEEKEPQLFVVDNARVKNGLFRTTFKDYETFNAHFTSAEYENIDMVYYFHCVSDWSDAKNVKRTERGWIATARNFIRKDIETGRLHKRQAESMNGVMDYLNNAL